ncbi:MAG: hypothetical protein FJ225_01630 [Lentisphaerae bacterium]|nr:hypothetical protein [Lentisphaerota bacterium]
MAGDIRAMLVLGAVFAALLALAELWKRRFDAPPERTRKFVHVAGGLACLAFPWVFRSAWTVLFMAVTLSLVIALGRRLRLLASLHGVDRRTRGSEYYPLAIFLLFALTREAPWFYVSAVLVLAVADAFAALIGSRYGRVRYEVEDEQKSLEGSLAFAAIAFLAILLPLLLMTDLPRATCALAALLVAVLVTGFEAVSLRGTDNLFVPLGVAVILAKITSKPQPEIVYQNVSLAVILALVALAVRRTHSFNVGGTITFALFAYGAWSLGSELWALPVFLGFLFYVALWLILPPARGRRHALRVRIVFHALAVPLLVLAAGNMTGRGALFYAPFIASLAAVLTFSTWNHCLQFRPPPERLRPVLAGVVGAGAAGIVAAAPWTMLRAASPGGLAAVAGLTAAAAVVNDRLIGPRPDLSSERLWSASRIALTAASAAAMWLLQAAGIIPAWR